MLSLVIIFLSEQGKKTLLFCFESKRKNDIINLTLCDKERIIMEIIEINSNNHKIKLYTNGVQKPQKIVLCLHGFNGDLWGDGFSKLRKKLSDEDKILVCSFDSAGHGESEVNSIDMTLDIVIQEITDVVNYLQDKYKDIPLYFYAISYGGYRAMVAISRNEYKNLREIILVNPAVKMLKTLEILKEFDYKKLSDDAIVPMKRSLNKFLSKKFLDDLYENDLFKLTYKTNVPIKLFIGKEDDLISKQDLKDFAELTKCDCEFLEDSHCVKDDKSWERIVESIKEL